ncbi:hypothetical protein FHX15_001333 [Rhizobium sp. BK650]|nr:hypothetical protein [Rhizobium sp. BK650]
MPIFAIRKGNHRIRLLLEQFVLRRRCLFTTQSRLLMIRADVCSNGWIEGEFWPRRPYIPLYPNLFF